MAFQRGFSLLHISPSIVLCEHNNTIGIKKTMPACGLSSQQDPRGILERTSFDRFIPERGLVTMWAVLLHNVDVVDFPNGNLAYFLLTIFTKRHSNHLTNKNCECPNNNRVLQIYKSISNSGQAVTRFI